MSMPENGAACNMATPLIVRDLRIEVPGRVLLRDVDLQLDSGECVAVMGPSGSGKTSLLQCLGGIRLPAAGTIKVAGSQMSTLNDAGRARKRLRHIGLVFQHCELIAELTTLENTALPLRLLGAKAREANAIAMRWLDALEISHLADQLPHQISGGEAQRAAISRALSTGPAVVLADEPTGALDETNSLAVGKVLTQQAKAAGAAVIIATHDPIIANMSDRILQISHTNLIEGSAR
jgi:putative ABC transport system ATP-binding protein